MGKGTGSHGVGDGEVQPYVAENTTAVVPTFSDEKWAQAAVLDSLNELNHTKHTPLATAHAVKL